MKELVTVEQLMAARYTFQAHVNCGGAGHFYFYRCETFPRLAIAKRSHRPDGIVVAYVVDGIEVEDLTAAAMLLSVLPGPAIQSPVEPPAQLDLEP